jgi:toxin FitB
VTYLVDANVLSEATKPEPESGVIEWLKTNQSKMVVDSVILSEIRLGIVRLPKGRKRENLQGWFDEGIRKLICIPWDYEVAIRWADLIVELQRAGHSLPLFDSMIAATALTHRLSVATRNRRDFEAAGVHVVNPFE